MSREKYETRTDPCRIRCENTIHDRFKGCVDYTMLDRIILRPNGDAQSANMDGETVLLALSTGRYYTLNRVGSIIWEHCTGQNTVRDIHAKLCENFEVAPELALDDLIALINELVQEGLLQQEMKQS